MLKQEISERSKKNYELEKDVRFFDQRIALLINHRIAVEVRRAGFNMYSLLDMLSYFGVF